MCSDTITVFFIPLGQYGVRVVNGRQTLSDKGKV